MASKSTPSQMVEWMCTCCGQRTTRFKSNGRPLPGKCSRRSNGGPHRWVKNREYERTFGG